MAGGAGLRANSIINIIAAVTCDPHVLVNFKNCGRESFVFIGIRLYGSKALRL